MMTSTSMSTSTGTVAALLREVYNAHTLTVESLTNHIEVLVRKCDRLAKFKDDILARGKDLQRRYDQLCEEHKLTQMTLKDTTMTLKDTTASETDSSKPLNLLNLDDEIGSRFPGREGKKTGPQQDDLGMDSCDGSVSKECSIGEGERSEDMGGQRRLKLVAGRKRARYIEEEKPLTKKKVKLSDSDTSPVRQEDCQRTQDSRSGRLGNRSQANNGSRVKTDTNSLGFDNNIVRKHENNHTKCDSRTEFITRSVTCKDESTKHVKDICLDTPSKFSSGTESQFTKGCETRRNSQKKSTQRQRMNKHEDVLSHSSDQHTQVKQSGRTNLQRCGETESTAKKGDSSQVMFVPETCYPDSCGPDSSPVAMDTVGTGYLRGSSNVPGTTPRKSLRTKKQSGKMPSTDTATTPMKSLQSKKQNRDFDERRERSKVMTSDKRHGSVERDTHQVSMCSDDADESGDVSEVFLLPEARLPGVFISPLCNSTPVDNTSKIGASQKVGCHENPLCDKLGRAMPKFPSLHDSPLLRSPKRDSQKNLRRKSAGSPLLFDDDADSTATKHERSRVCQTSGDSHSVVRTRGRNRLGGRSDANETVARGQLLSSSIDASKQADSIFFRDTEQEACSLKTSRQRRVDSKVGVTKTPTGDSTSRKLVQMTLSQHLQPNADRVPAKSMVSRSDEEEQLLIERAKKASLHDLDLRDVSRNEINVPPKVTGTQVAEFKEPMTPRKAKRHKDTCPAVSPCHMRDRGDTMEVVPETVPEEWEEEEEEEEGDHQLNGSVDPDIRLSAYIFTQSNQQEDSAQAGSKGTERRDLDRERGEREIDSCAPSVVFAPLRRQQMAPPATVDEYLNDEEDCMDRHLDDGEMEPDESMKEKKVHEDSFDRAPKASRPNYAYRDVVRKQAERRQLQATACPQCEQYFSTLGLSDEEKEERMKCCRHRDRFAPPQTPEHFWSVGFPDTQECEDRGYIHVTQARPSRFRRKRGLKKLFNDDTVEEDLALP